MKKSVKNTEASRDKDERVASAAKNKRASRKATDDASVSTEDRDALTSKSVGTRSAKGSKERVDSSKSSSRAASSTSKTIKATKASKPQKTTRRTKTESDAPESAPRFDLEKALAGLKKAAPSRQSATARSNEPTNRFGDVELPHWAPGWILVQGARKNNLKSIDVPFPLSALTVVTGVSGSGKSSLVEDVLYASLARSTSRAPRRFDVCDSILGAEGLKKISRVDQAPIGHSPTSNPATHTGAFDIIRTLFAQLPESQMRGYSSRRFSFNVPGGRCEKCEGAGQLKVEMHFLADVWTICDACGGKRYDEETLQIKYRGKSISDVLNATCGEALELFSDVPSLRRILKTLCDVGLDYLPLGQSAPTLSGGEAQRVKLASELSRFDGGAALYVLDEPTTGLHFTDVRKLLDVLQRLVDLGNTVVVVEHNLDVIKNADWIVDIGPEAGLEGGRLVYAGVPEGLLEYVARREASPKLKATSPRSYTGEALFPVFERSKFVERAPLDPREYWATAKAAIEKTKELEQEAERAASAHPWQIDGRRWHLELRPSRSGERCRWDSRILSAVADKLEELHFNGVLDWNNRSIVEARASERSGAWFFRATTTDEWLITLRFRTAKNSFNRDSLARSLDLKPLNEIDEIPLCGSKPRVKTDQLGAWQEIELKVFSFEEIDRPEFWSFVELAHERFVGAFESYNANEATLMPWTTQGREWHLSNEGLYGDSATPQRSVETVRKTLELLESVNLGGSATWTNKITVPFYAPKAKAFWAQVFTKNSDFTCIQINVDKGAAKPSKLSGLGGETELDVSDERVDSAYLRFRSFIELDLKRVKSFLEEAYDASIRRGD